MLNWQILLYLKMVYYSMQGKFSPEIRLVNTLRLALIEKEWTILQLVCSGGQAHFSITYSLDSKSKTVFPDLVAYKGNKILIGEIKELFDQKDHDKLLEISNSELAKSRITKNISIRTNIPSGDFLLDYVLINQDITSKQVSKINQINLSEGIFF